MCLSKENSSLNKTRQLLHTILLTTMIWQYQGGKRQIWTYPAKKVGELEGYYHRSKVRFVTELSVLIPQKKKQITIVKWIFKLTWILLNEKLAFMWSSSMCWYVLKCLLFDAFWLHLFSYFVDCFSQEERNLRSI